MSIFTTFTDDIILRRDYDEKAAKDIKDRIQTVESYINANMNGNIQPPTSINPLDDILARLSQMETTIAEQAKIILKLKKQINNI